MRRRFLLHLFLFTILATAPAWAQAPDTSTRAFYAALTNHSAERLNTLLNETDNEVRKGFVTLELHRRTNSNDYASQAARHFAGAIRADDRDAWAHLGLGLVLARAKKTMAIVRAMGVADGEAIQVSARVLDKALDLDPGLVEAAEQLEHVAEAARNRKAQAHAFEVLEKHGRIGLDDASNVPGATVLERAPKNALDFLLRARALFEKHEDAAGSDAYFNGLIVWDESAAAAYIEQALLIATPQEKIALTDGDLSKRGNALRLFWKKRAVRDGVSIAERTGEHYRRVAYARERFRVRSQAQAGRDVMGKLKTGIAAEMDDRGLIYIRYGPPTETSQIGTGFDRSSITWAYRKPDGRWQAYFFMGNRMQPPAYRLEPDLLKTLSTSSADPQDLAIALGHAAKYDQRYAFIAARMSTVRTYEFGKEILTPQARVANQRRQNERYEDMVRLNDRITFENRDQIFLAFERDAARPHYPKQLTVFHDFATFRGKGCTDVVYSVAVPAARYRVNIAVADTFVWEMQGVDTTVSKELPEGGLLRSTGVLCATPDYNSYARLTVSADSMTGVTAGGELRIHDYSDRANLLMSDVLFATVAPGGFVRGDAQLALIPHRQFKQGDAFRVFYELYNLPRNARYRTEITFSTVSGNPFAKLFKGRTKTTVSFDDTALRDDVIQELRTLVPEIEPGKVQVTIKVTELATNQTASNSETIWILPAEEENK